MRYAKLIEGVLFYAPRRLRDGETAVYNPPVGLLTARGWKPVIETEGPAVGEGFVAAPGWSETEDAIVRTWTAAPEGELPPDEVLAILMGGETL